MNEYKCEVEAKTACGSVRFYPLNDVARHFTALTRCDTLTKQHIKHIKELGFKFRAYYISNGNAMACPEGLED